MPHSRWTAPVAVLSALVALAGCSAPAAPATSTKDAPAASTPAAPGTSSQAAPVTGGASCSGQPGVVRVF